MTYCNTTTDLTRACDTIHSYYKAQKIVKGYKPHTTDNQFKVTNVGYVEVMYEDGIKMTSVASLVAVDAAQKYFYDTTNDILYWQATGGVADNFEYRVGEDFATVKSDAVAIASDEAEGILDKKYSTPIPMSPYGSPAYPYDRDFIHAVAMLACSYIVARREPKQYDSSGTATNMAAQLYDAGMAIIKDYVEGNRVFSWELTVDEIGGANVIPATTNTSGGVIQIKGKYDPSTYNQLTGLFAQADPYWKVKIITSGVLGTATFSVSKDNGTTYTGTVTATSNQWIYIDSGLWIRFLPFSTASTFVADDTWQFEITSPYAAVTSSSITSVPIMR